MGHRSAALLHAAARYAVGEFAGAKITSWAMNLTWLERAQAARLR